MHACRRVTAGAVVALAVALGLLVVGARPAAAHAELISSDPPAGSPLDGVPAEIVLLFSDVVEPSGATVQVLDGTGVDLAAGPLTNRAGDATSLVIPTTGAATAGTLSVVWTLVGTDGHVMSGMIGYTVGPAPTVATAAPAAAAVAAVERNVHRSERLAALARPASYVAFALLLGVPLFAVCIWPAGSRTASARLLHGAGAFAGITGAALMLASLAIGLEGSGGLATGVRRAVATRAGPWVLVELALVVVVAAIGAALPRGDRHQQRRWQVAAGVAAGALLLAHGRVGHSSTEGWWTTATHGAHVGAMSAWIGGLVGLLLVAVPAWSSRGVLKQQFHHHLRDFTRLATLAVGTLLWSGVLLLVTAWSDDRGLGREYRTVLAVKLLAVVVTLAAGYAGHRYVRQEPARRPTRNPVRSQVLTRRLAAEIALSTAVLAATAVLAGTSPAS